MRIAADNLNSYKKISNGVISFTLITSEILHNLKGKVFGGVISLI